MEVLKKSWWLFSLLGIASAFLNPYIGLFAIMPAIMYFIDGVLIGIGRIQCRNKTREGFQRIAAIQSSGIWFVILFNIVIQGIIIKAFADILNYPQKKNMGFIPMEAFNLSVWVPTMWILYIIFAVISLILFSLRIYDLYYNKNYTMKPRRIQFGYLKQVDTNSFWFRIWRGLGKIWYIFAVCSFVVGSLNFPYPAFTCFRFFFFFPFGISWINIRYFSRLLRIYANKEGDFYADCRARFQYQLDLFRKKGVFLTNIFALCFIEAMLLLGECMSGAAPLTLFLSILCDALLISSMSYHLWRLAEKR